MVLKDRRLSRDPKKAAPDSATALVLGEAREDPSPSILFIDGPDHKRLRGLVTKAFNSAEIAAESDGDRMTSLEIVVLCELLLLAGNLSTTDLIASAVYALMQNPEQLAKLRPPRWRRLCPGTAFAMFRRIPINAQQESIL